MKERESNYQKRSKAETVTSLHRVNTALASRYAAIPKRVNEAVGEASSKSGLGARNGSTYPEGTSHARDNVIRWFDASPSCTGSFQRRAACSS